MSASTLLKGRKRRVEVADEEDDETREVEMVEVEDGGGGEDGDGEGDGWSDHAEGEDEEVDDLLTTRTFQTDTDEWAGKNSYEVEAIEAVRWRRGSAFYLVQWEGLPKRAETWEPTEHFKGNGASILMAFIEQKVC
jgi:hypothetical protein